MKRLFFVYNEHAGKGIIRNKLAEIISMFTQAGYIVTAYPTQRALDAYDKVCEVDGEYDMVVCSGGDGTLNEVISAVMNHTHERPRIGYIPAGTTNDFATSYKIPKTPLKAAKVVLGDKYTKCDIGMFNGRYFNYVAAFGFLTDVSYKTPQNIKNVLGHQAYVLESIKSLNNIAAYRMNIKFDDMEIKGDFIYGMVANSYSVGGFKGITGNTVQLDDGLFEVVLVKEPLNALELQQVVAGLFSRTHDSPMVLRFKAKQIVFESQEPVAWTMDGEFGDAHQRVEISVLDKAVEIMSNL